MYLVQLFLPLYDNHKSAFPHSEFDRVFAELVNRFGGITAYQRAPAEGGWKAQGGRVSYDEVVTYEVMVPELEPDWWSAYRQELEGRFRQEELVIRATEIIRL